MAPHPSVPPPPGGRVSRIGIPPGRCAVGGGVRSFVPGASDERRHGEPEEGGQHHKRQGVHHAAVRGRLAFSDEGLPLVVLQGPARWLRTGADADRVEEGGDGRFGTPARSARPAGSRVGQRQDDDDDRSGHGQSGQADARPAQDAPGSSCSAEVVAGGRHRHSVVPPWAGGAISCARRRSPSCGGGFARLGGRRRRGRRTRPAGRHRSGTTPCAWPAWGWPGHAAGARRPPTATTRRVPDLPGRTRLSQVGDRRTRARSTRRPVDRNSLAPGCGATVTRL